MYEWLKTFLCDHAKLHCIYLYYQAQSTDAGLSDVMKHTQFPLDSSIVLSMASNGKTAPELDFCLGFYTTETGYILFRLSIDMSMLESLSMFTPKSGSLWPAMFIDYTAYSTN